MLNTEKKTVMIRRKNVFLDVAPEAVDGYLAKGYDLVDANGNVIKQHVPTDFNDLKVEYDKQVAEIKELKAKIKTLEAELIKLKESVPAESEEEIKPAKGRKPRK